MCSIFFCVWHQVLNNSFQIFCIAFYHYPISYIKMRNNSFLSNPDVLFHNHIRNQIANVDFLNSYFFVFISQLRKLKKFVRKFHKILIFLYGNRQIFLFFARKLSAFFYKLQISQGSGKRCAKVMRNAWNNIVQLCFLTFICSKNLLLFIHIFINLYCKFCNITVKAVNF